MLAEGTGVEPVILAELVFKTSALPSCPPSNNLLLDKGDIHHPPPVNGSISSQCNYTSDLRLVVKGKEFFRKLKAPTYSGLLVFKR